MELISIVSFLEFNPTQTTASTQTFKIITFKCIYSIVRSMIRFKEMSLLLHFILIYTESEIRWKRCYHGLNSSANVL